MKYEDEMENEEQSGDGEMHEEISYQNEEKSDIGESDEGKMPSTYDDESENLVEESDEEDSQESDDFEFAENLLSRLAVPTLKSFLEDAVPCAHNYSEELKCLWNSNGGCTPPSILHKNRLHDLLIPPSISKR